MFIRRLNLLIVVVTACLFACDASVTAESPPPSGAGLRPSIILVMADDQGWGETGYNGHPILKTPHLDAIAANGLRFNRFYAGAPVCSPTRATVLTGRTNDRTGTLSHGYALRRQEITIAQLLKSAGYVTSHFGKWHLNGLRGPGVPILKEDTHNPGNFGFDHWLSVTNFFDRDPILSRMGEFEEYQGDSSEIIVDQALEFLARHVGSGAATFTVLWFGTPHSPFKAATEDMVGFESLDVQSRHHYGELVAMDRSIGVLRDGLRKLGVHDKTLLWFCSDNGGLPKIKPTTVGPLRGFKNSIYEGGLRVPAIIHWPDQMPTSGQTDFPASVADILPTLLAITGVSHSDADRPIDGISLLPIIREPITQRTRPIFFRQAGRAALIDNDWKLLTNNLSQKDLSQKDLSQRDLSQRDLPSRQFELYNLADDVSEQINLVDSRPEIFNRMRIEFDQWNQSVDASDRGNDYPERKVDPREPQPRSWSDDERYRRYIDQWRTRWEYETWLKRRGR